MAGVAYALFMLFMDLCTEESIGLHLQFYHMKHLNFEAFFMLGISFILPY